VITGGLLLIAADVDHLLDQVARVAGAHLQAPRLVVRRCRYSTIDRVEGQPRLRQFSSKIRQNSSTRRVPRPDLVGNAAEERLVGERFGLQVRREHDQTSKGISNLRPVCSVR
jgi:hypothetical protein